LSEFCPHADAVSGIIFDNPAIATLRTARATRRDGLSSCMGGLIVGIDILLKK